MSPKTFLNSRRPSVFAGVVSAMLSCIAAPAAYAQNPTPGWNDATVEVPGTVEVSTSSLNLQKGKSVSYSLRLSKQPTDDGWWVRVFVDGAVRADGEYDVNGDGMVDITWVPSVGWEFNRNNWDQWRTIRITASDDAVLNKRVQFDHDVWDHTGNCPVHQVGVVAVTRGGNTVDSRISVSFDRSIYEAEEGGDPATVTVQLGRAPQNSVVIPINDSGEGGATSSDYSGIPSTVTFQSGETRQSFTVTATDDGDRRRQREGPDELRETARGVRSRQPGAGHGEPRRRRRSSRYRCSLTSRATRPPREVLQRRWWWS